MTLEEDILKELRQISKITLLANARVIEAELGKLANTTDKKKIWVLIDGKRMAKDIAKDGDVSERAVNYFITAASAANFIKYKKMEPPSKLLEYSPPDWINLLTEKGEEASGTSQTQATQETLTTLEQSNLAKKTSGVEKNG
jgi:hypothetical protein